MKTIRRGDRGSTVKRCQELLNAHGFDTGTPDGIFGRGTEAAAEKFQAAQSLDADGIVGKATWAALERKTIWDEKPAPTPLPPALVHLQSLGHDVVWTGDYHLNLFGIRSPTEEANAFDDILGCAYTVNKLWKVHYWPGTTDPGTYHLKNPSRVEGTAVLMPGQYKNTWKIDLHGGKYTALCQRAGAVTVARDHTLDNIVDVDASTKMTGFYGINLHRSSASGESTRVDRWSAGCQVHARTAGFEDMMTLARLQVDKLGLDTFTYTLMDQWWGTGDK